MILTDNNGRPFERPTAPAQDAGIDAKIAYLRAMAVFQDVVADCANAAFADQLRRSLKQDKVAA